MGSQVKCDRDSPCARCVRLGLVCEPQYRKRGRPPADPQDPFGKRPFRRAKERPSYLQPPDEALEDKGFEDRDSSGSKKGKAGKKRRKKAPQRSPVSRPGSAMAGALGGGGGAAAASEVDPDPDDDPEPPHPSLNLNRSGSGSSAALAAVPAPGTLIRRDSGTLLGEGTQALMSTFVKLHGADGLDAERTRAVLRSWGLMSARYQHSHFTTVLSNLAKAVALDLETLVRRPSPRATAAHTHTHTHSQSPRAADIATSSLPRAFQPDKMEAYLRELFLAPSPCFVQIGVRGWGAVREGRLLSNMPDRGILVADRR
jgi:hypothetical protein